MNAPDTFHWLCDVYLLATVLLAACGLASQPARRIALSWATAAGLAALVLLCAVPGWSRWHLGPIATSAEVVPLHRVEVPSTLADATRGVESKLVPPAPVPLKVALAEPNVEVDYALIVVGVYLTGSFLVLGWLALGGWQVHRLCSQAQAAPPQVAEILRELTKNPRPRTRGRGQGEGVFQVRTLAKLPSAVAVGLLRPVILLPESLLKTSQPRQLRTVLAHELAHIDHCDLWLLAAVRGLFVLFWAHPLFWLWRRRVRLDQELLADTAAADLTSRADYAEELVALARQSTVERVSPLAASVGLWETRSQLAKRVAVLLNQRLTILRNCTRRWRIGSLAALVGLALGLSLVTFSPAEPVKEKEEANKPAAQTLNLTPEPNNGNELLKELRSAQKPNTIIGICQDEHGKPLSGVEVTVTVTDWSGQFEKTQKLASTTSDPTGRFQFENVIDIAKEFPKGLPDKNVSPQEDSVVSILGRAKGRIPGKLLNMKMTTEVARDGIVAVLKMPPAQTLSGRVTDEQGKPIAGARVIAGLLPSPIPGMPADVNSATTDENGEYSINNLEGYNAEAVKREVESHDEDIFALYAGTDLVAPWQRLIWIKHPNYAMKRAVVDEIPGRVDVILRPGAVLTGQVFTRDTDGTQQPAAGARLELQRLQPTDPTEGGFLLYQEDRYTNSNNQGRYRFELLPAGTYALVVQSERWAYQRLENLEVKSGETMASPEVVLNRGGQVKIQLVDDATGKRLHFDKPTKSQVGAFPLPWNRKFRLANSIVEFSNEGIGTAQVPAGKYSLWVNIPSSKEQPGWNDADYSQIRAMEDYDKLPAVTVEEGKVVEVTKRLKRLDFSQGATATAVLGHSEKSPPLPDEEEQPKVDGTLDLVPATPPAE